MRCASLQAESQEDSRIRKIKTGGIAMRDRLVTMVVGSVGIGLIWALFWGLLVAGLE